MFKLHRHKSNSSSSSSDQKSVEEKIEFKFSNIQAFQVPKGWDKLYVSLISARKGKTISKSGKALVRNGNCRWTETLSDSIWMPQGDDSKDIEQCLFKLVISMGSARSSILGEASVDLAGYMSSKASVPISLPLKKCVHGTIVQVEVQCLAPRSKPRTEKSKDVHSFTKDVTVDDEDIDSISNGSSGTKSFGSSSSNLTCPGEHGSRETSFSALGSHPSFDSEDSLGRESLSPQSNLSGALNNVIGRQDSTGSQNSASHGSYHGYDSPMLNQSSYSGKILHSRREDAGRSLHSIATSPLHNVNSSKSFSDSGDPKTEELRAEAGMWERNARKLMLDVEFLRKEFKDQAKESANLGLELSASQTECGALKREIKHLKEEARKKQNDLEDMKLQALDKDNIQRELDDEIRFLRESNSNLALQLKKTQDSNAELVSILQEMEETVDEQKVEIENLSTLKSKYIDTECKCNYEQKDIEEVNSTEQVLREKIIESSCDLDPRSCIVEHVITDVSTVVQQEKKSDIEVQFPELQKSDTVLYTEQTLGTRNHEIASERDIKTQGFEGHLTRKTVEVEMNLDTELSKAHNGQELGIPDHEKRGNHILINEIESLKEKVQELERDCTELTDENLELIFKLKESEKIISTSATSLNSLSFHSQEDTSKCTCKSEESNNEPQLWQLKENMKKKEILLNGVGSGHLQIQISDLESKCTDLELQLHASEDKAFYLNAELQKKHAQIEQQECKIASLQQKLTCQKEEKTQNDLIIQQEQPESILENFVQTKNLLDKEQSESEDNAQCSKEEATVKEGNYCNFQNIRENDNLRAHMHCSSGRLENLNKELNLRVADLKEDLLTKDSEIEELKADSLLKEIEIEALRHQQGNSKTQISDLQKWINELERNVKAMQRDGSMTSECSNTLNSDMVMLKRSPDSHDSANKIIEKKVLELENCRHQLEDNLTELENENVQLSERVSGLEAQLRYMTEAREGSRLEAQHSETQIMNLQEEINRLVTETEGQKVDMRNKLEDMQRRWLEAEEQSVYLKKANPKLQATAESLIGECNSLQKTNGELRQQRLEMHKRCSELEAELRESQNRFSGFSMRFEVLEEKFSSMLTEFASKEEALASELDAIHILDDKYKETFDLGESLLHQMYLEKAAEVEKLQQEVAHLNSQISATHDERERRGSEAVMEMHNLRANNDKLEADLTEACDELKISEKKLYMIQVESDSKVQHLTGELAIFKQNHEIVLAKHEKLLGLFNDVKCNEEKLKTTVDELESKLRSTYCEKLQLQEETFSLKTQLQEIALLRDEVLALKTSVNEMKFDKQRLEAELQLVSGEYEEVKFERCQLIQRTSSMQKTASELEDCKRSKVALEEKIMRLEGDLSAREALCAQDAELKNEVGRIKRTNSQLQWKIKCLEEEKEENFDKVRALQEDLKQKEGINSTSDHLPGSSAMYTANEAPKSLEVNNKRKNDTGNNSSLDIDFASRIQFLETELAEALEANDMYKAQLKSMLSDGHSDSSHKNVKADGEATNRECNDRKVSLLEAELKELRERYFDKSLKCAEVESQREQLVMKLKATTNSRRNWFS